jgi:hypothetical protein
MKPNNEATNRLDLPSYPKAFIAAGKFTREPRRVFIAMPFEASHSEDIWKRIQAVCARQQLEPHRADTSVYPRAIIVDILEELERAQIIIADLTGLNSNVLYELGIAHARCESVVLLARRDERLPFDLASLRCHVYDWTKAGLDELEEALGRTLEALKMPLAPVVLDTQLERTRAVLADLRQLADLPDEDLHNETIWFSGFLSSFAISDEEHQDNPSFRDLLHQERDLLILLARRGCRIRCVITPPRKPLPQDRPQSFVRIRLNALITFLKSGDPALANIDWAVSPFLEKSNFYIIGNLCCTEGFRAGAERGYTLTLRQTDPTTIQANRQVQRVLFDRLRTYTLTAYSPQSSQTSEQEALRAATLQCLERALGHCD